MRIQPVALVLVVIAVLLFVVAVLYLTQTTLHLPGFIPGSVKLPKGRHVCGPTKTPRCFTPRKFSKRGIAAGGLGVVALVGAWYTSGLRTKRPADSDA